MFPDLNPESTLAYTVCYIVQSPVEKLFRFRVTEEILQELIRLSRRYCDKCKSNLVNGFNSVLQGRKPAESSTTTRRSGDARMRFLSDDK